MINFPALAENFTMGRYAAVKFNDPDTGQIVIYIPELDVCSYGETEEKAREMMTFVLQDCRNRTAGC